MRVSLGNKKSFGKPSKPWSVYQIFFSFPNDSCIEKINSKKFGFVLPLRRLLNWTNTYRLQIRKWVIYRNNIEYDK